MTFVRPDALAYNLIEAAQVTGLSKDSLYRAVKSGELRAKRTSSDKVTGQPTGKILVLRRDLEQFLDELPDDWWGHQY